MDKLVFYGLMHNENKALSNILTGMDDANVCKYLLVQLDKVRDELDDNRKALFESEIRECSIVRIGTLDLLNHNLENDFNVLVNLFDYKLKDVKEDNK